jgi:GDP-L-fucose synthase
MDSSRLRSLGWEPKIDLEEGVKKTYSWFLDNQDEFKEVKLS